MTFKELQEQRYTKLLKSKFNCELISFYQYSNKSTTVRWIGPDNKNQLAHNNVKAKLSEQERKSIDYYVKNPIEYKINSLGLRDIELAHKPKEVDVYLGCSHTFGVGLHEKHLWTTKLGNYTEFPYINAGIPGSGVMTQFRLFKYLSKRFKIRKLFHYSLIEHVRYEWFNGEDYVSANIHAPINAHTHADSPLWFEENLTTQKYIYYHAINSLCNELNIEYIPFTDETLGIYISSVEKFEDSDLLARDLSHHPVYKHQQIYKNCITYYN